MSFIRKVGLVLLMTPLLCIYAYAGQEFRPVASDKAQVVSGNARFTVLTSRLVRMEWSENATFEDHATLGIVNRELEVPAFDVRKTASKVVIRTSDLTLTYSGKEKFSDQNLSVVFKMADSKAKNGVRSATWRPGMDDSANLLGTCRTLDKCDGITTIDPYDKGIISRDGWAVVDESERHLLVPVESDWKYWVECRPEGARIDLYLFAYGHDYLGALNDFVKISGKIPLPPKYTFGYWWCRYWEYSDFELLDLSDHFMAYNIPMDVMIIDMDWHETWNDIARDCPRRIPGKPKQASDEFGQRIGWTGYTWKKELFPDPENFLGELHRRGIRTSLNLHFNNGIQPYEEPYQRFVSDYLSRTDDYEGPKNYIYDGPFQYKGSEFVVGEAGQKAPVPFRMSQMAWADAYFNSIIRPFERQGVDFWWLDWQQWKESIYVKDLSNTFWLNYTFFNDKVRQTESLGLDAPRPMIYHRWGGIGSHRYQVGFSGDVYATWQALSYLPYFTATASNVGYGYWGHDIGGHMQPKGINETDPELYTRWIQSGVFTPIFKTHSTKDTSMEKRFWMFPDHFDPMREAIRLRYDLTPYIYTAARQAYDSGLSICRPLYYYWPEADAAYEWKEQYMFGDDILATVVCSPADAVTGLAERAVWFPEGQDWYDMATGIVYKGGSTHTLLYTINENPYYVKAGAVIPMAAEDLMTLQTQSPDIRLCVIPGLGTSTASLYEDDGHSQSYVKEYAVTEVHKTASAGNVRLVVEPRKGYFKGMCTGRRLSVVLEGHYAPSKVLVNGKEVRYSRYAVYEKGQGSPVWGYDGYDMQARIYLPESSADERIEIECIYDSSDRMYLTGCRGLVKRITSMTPEAKLRFAKLKLPDFQLPSEFMNVAQCGSYINEDPFNAETYVNALDVEAMIANINSWENLSADFKAKVNAQIKFQK